MIKKFCDCCRIEIRDKEMFGAVQIPNKLYSAIIEGKIIEEVDEQPKQDFLNFRSERQMTVRTLEVCIECLIKFVKLTEEMKRHYKERTFHD